MQEVDAALVPPAAKARSRPIVSFLPLGPRPEIRVAPPAIEHDGAPKLSKAKAAAIAKENRLLQKQLTEELKEKLTDQVFAAAHCSGTAPILLYRNEIEAVKVEAGHMWASIHKTHDMWRSDLTVFCRICGSASSSYNTKALRDPCDKTAAATGYHNLLKR